MATELMTNVRQIAAVARRDTSTSLVRTFGQPTWSKVTLLWIGLAVSAALELSVFIDLGESSPWRRAVRLEGEPGT